MVHHDLPPGSEAGSSSSRSIPSGDSSLLDQSEWITNSNTRPLAINRSSSNKALFKRPYKKLPTVNSADQMVAQPATQPSKASGKLLRAPTGSSTESPASSRMCRQPGPKGQVLR